MTELRTCESFARVYEQLTTWRRVASMPVAAGDDANDWLIDSYEGRSAAAVTKCHICLVRRRAPAD